MKKQDLKSGVHSVVLRDGTRAIFNGEWFDFTDENNSVSLEMYSDDLTHSNGCGYDVVEVTELKPLWQRPQPKEMIEIDGVEYELDRVKIALEKSYLPEKWREFDEDDKEAPSKKKHVIEYDNKEDHLYSIINADSIETRLYYDSEIDESFLSHGRYRKTKENAEYSLERNKRANRLEALVEDIQGELDKGGYEICYDKAENKWMIDDRCVHIPNIGSIRMLYETAEKICQLLNDGLYEL